MAMEESSTSKETATPTAALNNATSGIHDDRIVQ